MAKSKLILIVLLAVTVIITFVYALNDWSLLNGLEIIDYSRYRSFRKIVESYLDELVHWGISIVSIIRSREVYAIWRLQYAVKYKE